MKAIIIDPCKTFRQDLAGLLHKNFSQINVSGTFNTIKESISEINSITPDLMFWNTECDENFNRASNLMPLHDQCRTIYILSPQYHCSMALHDRAVGFLMKPLRTAELLEIVNYYLNDSQEINKSQIKTPMESDLVCIPTMDGAEFLKPSEIIRCEGLQKCTRIVLAERSIVSSYPIGVFRDVLDGLGFILIHKSHLVNADHIRKYHREGSLYMSDGTSVPVARRKKGEIFKGMRHPQLVVGNRNRNQT